MKFEWIESVTFIFFFKSVFESEILIAKYMSIIILYV